MSTRPTLFFDFDGFLFDSTPAHMAYINKRYGVNTVLADHIDSPWIDTILAKYLPRGTIPDRADIYVDSTLNYLTSMDIHAEVKPIEGMCEVVRQLAERYSLWIVTAREKSGHAVVRHLIDLHIPGCISGIHHVWEYMGGKEFKRVASKRDFIATFPGKGIAFFDDSPTEVVGVQGLLPSYLFDPSGHHGNDARIERRVRSWPEIGKLLLAE